MKMVEGIWLPDGEQHLIEHLRRRENHIQGRGTYQFKKIAAAIAVCLPDRRRVAIDIGANVGLWSMHFARVFQRVIAFEPIEDLASCLRLNVQPNRNIAVYQLAVGDTDRATILATYADHVGYTHIDYTGGEFGGRDKIPTGLPCALMRRLDSLDYLSDDRVDLIKIDIEGFEFFAIQGAEKMIKREKPAMVIEQKPGHAERFGARQHSARDLLTSWGMRVAWQIGDDWCLAW